MTMLLKLLQPLAMIQILFDKEFTHLDLSLVLGTAAVCFKIKIFSYLPLTSKLRTYFILLHSCFSQL